MESAEIERLSQAWIRLHHVERGTEEHGREFWAFDKLSDLCESEPMDAWTVVQFIYQASFDDALLSNLAAGPLEDLLVQHGLQLIDKVEAKCADDSGFARLLGMVWKNDIDERVWDRMQRVVRRYA